MNCNHCGAIIESGETFCPNCGSKIPKQSFCRSCGAPMSDGELFCSKCGAKAISEMPQNSIPNNKGNSQAALITGIISAAVLCVLIVVLIILWPNKSRTNDVMKELPKPTQTFNHTETAQPTAAHTAAPTYTPVPTYTPIPRATPDARAVGYTSFHDSSNGATFYYPDTFRTVTDNLYNDEFIRRSLISNDDGGQIDICATLITTHTPSSVGNGFIVKYPSGVKERNKYTSTTCEILISDSNIYHYCYYDMSGQYLRGFEMHFTGAQRNLYVNTYAPYMINNMVIYN